MANGFHLVLEKFSEKVVLMWQCKSETDLDKFVTELFSLSNGFRLSN